MAAAVLTFAALGVAPSRAMEEPTVYRGVLILERKIDFGEYDRLRKFLSVKSTFDKISGGVFLASPGGNLQEASKIGRLIRALGLSTAAPQGDSNGGRRLGESPVRPENLRNPGNYLWILFDERTHRAVEAYLRAMNVRIKYLDLMFATPSSDVRWITQDELDSDLQGFIPELKDQAAARCAD